MGMAAPGKVIFLLFEGYKFQLRMWINIGIVTCKKFTSPTLVTCKKCTFPTLGCSSLLNQYLLSMSLYCDVIMSVMVSQITSVVCSIVGSSAEEDIKALHHWLLWGDSPVAGEFPAQKASNMENVSIWWRHHVSSRWRKHSHYKMVNKKQKTCTVDNSKLACDESKVWGSLWYFSEPGDHFDVKCPLTMIGNS